MLKKILKIIKFILLAVLAGVLCVMFISSRAQRLENLARIVEKEYSTAKEYPDLKYAMYFRNIPLGYLNFTAEETEHETSAPANSKSTRAVYKAELSIRPGSLLRTVSSDSIGIDYTSFVDKNTLLPYRFDQLSVYKKNKGKTPKSILYYHDDLAMERKGALEDVLDDTRDFSSLLLWLMSHDYEKTPLVKTTLNINRTIYLVVGKVKNISSLEGMPAVQVNIKFIQLDKRYNTVNSLPMTVFLLKKDKHYLPAYIEVKKGLLHITLGLI